MSVAGGSPTVSILGGQGGNSDSLSVTEFPRNGATNGATGLSSLTTLASSNVAICLPSDVSIGVTDNQLVDRPGTSITYVITISASAANTVAGVNVVDVFPASITGISWTCAASAGGGQRTRRDTGHHPQVHPDAARYPRLIADKSWVPGATKEHGGEQALLPDGLCAC